MQQIKEVLRLRLITAITGRYICSSNERKLFVLPIRFGELGHLDYCETQKV